MTFPVTDEVITDDPYHPLIVKFDIADATQFGQYTLDKESVVDMLHKYAQKVKARTATISLTRGLDEDYRVNMLDIDAIVENLKFNDDFTQVTMYLRTLQTTPGRLAKSTVTNFSTLKCELAGKVNEDLSVHDLQLLNIKVDA